MQPHEIVAEIKRFPLDAALLQHFFDRVDETRGDHAHEFLAPLRAQGFYEHIPDIIQEGDSVRHPPWPAGRFLAKHAGAAPEIAFDILSKLPESRNRFVLVHSFDAAALLPLDLLDNWVRGKRRAWRRVHYWDVLLAEKLGVIAWRLLEGGRPRSGLALANFLLRPAPTGTSEADTRDPQARLRVDDYEAERLIEQHLQESVRLNPLATVLFFSKQLERVLSGWADPKYPFGHRETGERERLNGGWGEVRRRDGTLLKQ